MFVTPYSTVHANSENTFFRVIYRQYTMSHANYCSTALPGQRPNYKDHRRNWLKSNDQLRIMAIVMCGSHLASTVGQSRKLGVDFIGSVSPISVHIIPVEFQSSYCATPFILAKCESGIIVSDII